MQTFATPIPPEVLGFECHESALVLDHPLRRLAAQDARGRMVLGRLVAAFLAAFARGDISWAHVRLLVRVTEPDTQDHWLSLARGHTVRALEARMRQAASPGAPPTIAPHDDDEAPTTRFALPCPRRIVLLWHHALEFSRTQALTLLPVVTVGTAAAWVARARQVTLRRLDDEVGWALAVRVPCNPVLPPALGARRPACSAGAADVCGR